MTEIDEQSEYQRKLQERAELLQRVDAIPAEREIDIRLTKGDVALLIRSQAQLFKAMHFLIRQALRDDDADEAYSARTAVTRSAKDFDTVTDGILRQIAEQAGD